MAIRKKSGTGNGGAARATAIKPGYLIAATLKEGTAPLRCYVGRVEDVDEYGLRLTLVDWLVGMAVSWDFFIPWDSLTAALIATPEHSTEMFGEAAAEFQTRCNHMAEGKEAMERAVEEHNKLRARARRRSSH